MILVQSVTIEHHRENLGIGEATPRISWKFKGADNDWKQSSYEIEIFRPSVDADEPHLFHVESSESVLVPWPTTPLRSKETATIRVRVRRETENTFTSWSEAVTVETGLLFSRGLDRHRDRGPTCT